MILVVGFSVVVFFGWFLLIFLELAVVRVVASRVVAWVLSVVVWISSVSAVSSSLVSTVVRMGSVGVGSGEDWSVGAVIGRGEGRSGEVEVVARAITSSETVIVGMLFSMRIFGKRVAKSLLFSPASLLAMAAQA